MPVRTRTLRPPPSPCFFTFPHPPCGTSLPVLPPPAHPPAHPPALDLAGGARDASGAAPLPLDGQLRLHLRPRAGRQQSDAVLIPAAAHAPHRAPLDPYAHGQGLCPRVPQHKQRELPTATHPQAANQSRTAVHRLAAMCSISISVSARLTVAVAIDSCVCCIDRAVLS